MAMKTNKSYGKRLKVTKSGKILARKTGQNHFNSKERHSAKGAKGGRVEFHMSNKERSRFLVNL
jgi:ribosomal protein L35